MKFFFVVVLAGIASGVPQVTFFDGQSGGVHQIPTSSVFSNVGGVTSSNFGGHQTFSAKGFSITQQHALPEATPQVSHTITTQTQHFTPIIIHHPDEVIQNYRFAVKHHNYDIPVQRTINHDYHIAQVQDIHEKKRVTVEDHLLQHNIHNKNIHLTTLNRHNFHHNQVTRRNVTVEKIHKPIIHNTDEIRENIIPNEQHEFNVIPKGASTISGETQNVQQHPPIEINQGEITGNPFLRGRESGPNQNTARLLAAIRKLRGQ